MRTNDKRSRDCNYLTTRTLDLSSDASSAKDATKIAKQFTRFTTRRKNQLTRATRSTSVAAELLEQYLIIGHQTSECIGIDVVSSKIGIADEKHKVVVCRLANHLSHCTLQRFDGLVATRAVLGMRLHSKQHLESLFGIDWRLLVVHERYLGSICSTSARA